MPFENHDLSGINVDTKDFRQVNHDYNYPRDLDLKPGSRFHDGLVRMILARATESARAVGERHKDWQEVDRKLRAYVPTNSIPKGDRGHQEDDVMPKIIIPITYASLQTHLTYMMAAFMQPPVFRYKGVGPEDMLGSLLMQMVVEQQVKRAKVGLSLHTMFRDGFAYGIGPASPMWYQSYGVQTRAETLGAFDEFLSRFLPTKRRKVREYGLLYEGNRLDNIDPYRFLPDPNVAAHDVQSAEYVGWIERTNLLDLLDEERNNKDRFNAKYLRHTKDRLSGLSNDVRGRSHKHQDRYGRQATMTRNPVDVVWMYVNLIPNAWGLGPSEFPEKWVFALAGDKVILQARPVGLDHNMFPVVVCAPDFDGYSAVPASRMGVVQDLQNMIDFLYSSHIMNIRKAINDMFVVDPSLVNVFDLNDPKPGKLIRLRRSAWGRGGVKDAIMQLPVQDVTANHVNDVAYLTDTVQMVTGAEDSVMGRIKPRTSRISATEAGGARSSSLSRLEMTAQIIAMQAIQPIGHMFASHTAQLMSQETYVQVVGEMEERLRQDFNIEPSGGSRMRVGPLDLLVNYDLDEHDATVPGSQDVNTWIDLFTVLSENPIVGQQFEMTRMLKHIARLMGAKNIDDFVKRAPAPQVMEDNDVAQQVQQGNLVDINQVGGDGV